MNISKIIGLAAAAMLLAPVAAGAADAPAAFGTCKACHKVEAGAKGMGPSLFGIVGRKAATVDGFTYSDAMKASGKTWDAATLAPFLSDPKGTLPGNKMGFPGVKAADDVKAIIDYLATLK
jgi:cytochrome c